MAAQRPSAAPLLNTNGSKAGEQEDGGMDEVPNMFASFRQMAGSQVGLLQDLSSPTISIVLCRAAGIHSGSGPDCCG